MFRLFKGEQNVRGGVGKDGSPGRIEAYCKSLVVAPGTWREWEGTYTVIKPLNACIFQLMHEGSLWPFHIDMTPEGEIEQLSAPDAALRAAVDATNNGRRAVQTILFHDGPPSHVD